MHLIWKRITSTKSTRVNSPVHLHPSLQWVLTVKTANIVYKVLVYLPKENQFLCFIGVQAIVGCVFGYIHTIHTAHFSPKNRKRKISNIHKEY